MSTPRYPLTRTMHGLTAAYCAYALASPAHLHNGLGEYAGDRLNTDRVARTFGGRDLALSVVGLVAPASVVPATLALRIAGDVTDASVLGSSTGGSVRTKMLGITLGWAALNVAAFTLDRRRA